MSRKPILFVPLKAGEYSTADYAELMGRSRQCVLTQIKRTLAGERSGLQDGVNVKKIGKTWILVVEQDIKPKPLS